MRSEREGTERNGTVGKEERGEKRRKRRRRGGVGENTKGRKKGNGEGAVLLHPPLRNPRSATECNIGISFNRKYTRKPATLK